MPILKSAVPRDVDLYVNYYREADDARRAELEACVLRNAAAGFRRIFCLADALPTDAPAHMTLVPIERRPTFDDFMAAINAHAGAETLSVLANLDIWFDQVFVDRLRMLDLRGTCLALSRWDDTPRGITAFPRRDSQDVWIWQGKVRPVQMPYFLGRLGCDNRFAHELAAAGYEVLNPSETLRVFHLHRTGLRHYTRDPAQVVPKPYLRVAPSELIVNESRAVKNELQHFAEKKTYSQKGEDGMLEEMVRRLGLGGGWFVEMGAGDGLQLSNTRVFAEQGWRGLWIEGDPDNYRKLRENTRGLPKIKTENAYVSCEPGARFDELLDRHEVPQDFEVLSLDIDGNDYWVWKDLQRRPKIVVVERNSNFSPAASLSIAYEPGFRFECSDYHGATARAMWKLANAKGYILVGWLGVNLFFVRRDCAGPFTEVPIGDVPMFRCWRPSPRKMVEV